MEQCAELEVDLFALASPSLEDIDKTVEQVLSSAINQDRFAEQVGENLKKTSPKDRLKVGIGLYLLNRPAEACERLQKAADCKEKYFYLAYALRDVGRYEEAIECLDKSLSHQADALAVVMEKVATYRMARNVEAAELELAGCGNYGDVSAEYHYQKARLLELKASYDEAIENYLKAIELSPGHMEARFHLALRYDLTGNDDQALACYKRIVSGPRCFVNALLNLAVLYEDAGQYGLATQCVDRVLEAFPTHKRALLFSRDIESSKTMFFDEEGERCLSRKNQILETPISDFELSVRSRNCLKKMNIHTLGDLLNISESELLSYKNFGDTSLREIKIILETKGLSLGLAMEDGQFAEMPLPEEVEEEDQGMLSKPIEDLQLTVRSRKCLTKLSMFTIGDLTRTTEAELLGCKNFGQTSLVEVNKALALVGLSLRRVD